MICLRGHNWVHFVHRLYIYSVLLQNSNFALRNLKLLAIRVKEIFEPLVLSKKGDKFFGSFQKRFLEKPIFE